METAEVPLDSIRVSDLNARKNLEAGTEDAGIADLANSIRQQGLLSPVIVRRAEDGSFDLIAGQRRLLACRELGLPTILATIRNDLSDADSTVVSLVENVQRADMHPIDKAQAYEAIRTSCRSIRDVARTTGVTEATVRRYLNLLKLAPAIQDMAGTSQGAAGVGTLSKLAATFPPEQQEEVLDEIGELKQEQQLEILRRSNGDLDAVREIKEEIIERDLHLRMCREGLCGLMPEEWKSRIRELLSDSAQPVDLQLPPLKSPSSSVH